MYDPTKVSFSWGGVAAVGYQDGDMIQWEHDNEEASSYVGTRGEGVNVYSPDKRTTITVTLQSASPTNLAWSALYDVKSELPAICIDRSSAAAVAFAQKAMCKKKPSMTRGRDNPICEWVFTAPHSTIEHAGDSSV
jgi:hypothetical protein